LIGRLSVVLLASAFPGHARSTASSRHELDTVVKGALYNFKSSAPRSPCPGATACPELNGPK